MKILKQNLTEKLASQPNIIFLLDGVGAVISFLLLMVILNYGNEIIGMPAKALKGLALISALLCFYSLGCYLFLRYRFALFIRIIGFANLLYCIVTIGVGLFYRSVLTKQGSAYFFAEIIVICALVNIELSVAGRLKKNQEELH